MLYLNRVVFVKRIVNRQFRMMSTRTTEGIKRRIEDEYNNNGFRRGVVEPPVHVAQPAEAKQQAGEDNRMTKIEVVNKSLSSFVCKNV